MVFRLVFREMPAHLDYKTHRTTDENEEPLEADPGHIRASHALRGARPFLERIRAPLGLASRSIRKVQWTLTSLNAFSLARLPFRNRLSAPMNAVLHFPFCLGVRPGLCKCA